MKKKPELLAPAGTMNAIIAAINGGADAVYFGGKAFNARRNAENMTENEIRTAVTLCHHHGVKVYVTLNILIKNSEFAALVETLNFLKGLELDGLIVQDIGLVYLLQHYFPEFRLQTSTQASVYGLEGTRFFQELGFSRVVLPREMPLSEVAEIKKNADVELKIFCHGALCYAYSGQCLMSSLIGGRSGNRGLCAQPCRKTYRLFDEAGQLLDQGYLLSPKDLNTLDQMKAIVASGVDALKIEGRMKTPEYVYGITRAYREQIDAVCQGNGRKTIDDQAVMQVFNRDFTSGHLFDQADILNPQVGKNRGVLIGRVTALPKSKKRQNQGAYQQLGLQLNGEARLAVGDGLSFGEDGKTGTKVDALFSFAGSPLKKAAGGETVAIPCRFAVAPGTLLYKNYDSELMEQLSRLGSEPVALPAPVVDFRVTIKANSRVTIKAATGAAEITHVADFLPERPIRKPLDAAMVKEQLARLGGTGFTLGTIAVELEPELFLARSQLNALRKEVLEKLEAKISQADLQKTTAQVTVIPLKQELSGQVKPATGQKKRVSLEFEKLPTREDLTRLKGLGLAEVVIPLQEEAAGAVAAFAKDCGLAVLLKTPRVTDAEETRRLKRSLDMNFEHDGFLIGNYEGLQLLKDRPDYLEADQSFNLFNTLAAHALTEWQLDGGVLSPELDDVQIREISEHTTLKTVLPVYGRQELMVSRKCLFNCAACSEKINGKTGLCHKQMAGSLVDERSGCFPVRRDQQGLIHLYNRDVLFLRAEILDLSGVDTWRIYHREEALDALKPVIGYYSHAIYEKNGGLPEGLTTVGTTRGSFKRGVK
jgi:putative protease